MSDSFLYGARLDAVRMVSTLSHLFSANLAAQAHGRAATPICIWGTHGIGKTMLVEAYARQRGWAYACCAPAQLEEMGDLNGLPVLEEVNGQQVTRFAPPNWVPREPGPGILLLDDINRADDRILRGLMPLLQTSTMLSWSLPPRWQIVATANPEGGDYSVTPMDDAMLTRMLHLSLRFEPRAWAAWASRNSIDERGIAFVLTYPEVVTGRRTTPRSLTQFFRQLASITDLKASEELVYTLGMSALDEATVGAFMAFVNDNLQELISPQELLSARDFAPIAQRLSVLSDGGTRLDHISTICTRLFLALSRPDYAPQAGHQDNLVAFLMHEALPHDLRMSLHRDLSNVPREEVRAMLYDPRLAMMVMDGL